MAPLVCRVGSYVKKNNGFLLWGEEGVLRAFKIKGEHQMKRNEKHLYKSFYVMGAALMGCLLLLPFLPFFPAGAQTPSLNDEVDVQINAFFTAFSGSRGNPSFSAFEDLLRQSPYDFSETGQAMTDLRKKMEELSAQYGLILHHERYDTHRIGEDIIVSRYILKHEHGPVVWTFVFYRKPAMTTSLASLNTWMFVQLYFETDLRSLL